jgi:biopolymer transport protein ExbD
VPVAIRKSPSAATLSLTPMIDVVFLLLIFFLVSTRFEQEERDMDVDLPQASEAEPTTFQGKDIFVTVTPEGRYFVEGKQLDASGVEAFLTAAHQSNPGGQRVMIRADRESRTRHVVAVMNACNKAHIRNYSIATE